MISSGNDIFYRTTSDKTILELVDRDIALLLKKQSTGLTKFKASSVIIITYNNVARYNRASNRFKYQTIIATDYKNTFTIINYHRLDESGTVAGFYERSPCKVNTKLFTNSFDRRVLTKNTNIGILGKHVYQLTVDDKHSCLNKGG
jgi:hypothetical protein